MDSPVQIDFQGMAPSEPLRGAIARHVAELETFCGRVTGARVVLKAPTPHHRTSSLYEINIHLGLPDGRAVDVGRTPHQDERHADPRFAIADAFRRARRRLQDQARRLRGDVKHHDDQPIGTVRRIDPAARFGFIETADGRDVYFHAHSVLAGGFGRLKPGTRVAFCEEAGEKGPQASTVRRLGKHALR